MGLSELVTGKKTAGAPPALNGLDAIPPLESFAPVVEAKVRLRAIDARGGENAEKIKRIENVLNKPPVPLGIRGEAALRGEVISPAPSKEELPKLYDERAVILSATMTATAALKETVGVASVEVCRKLAPGHQALVKEIVTRAVALSQALDVEWELRQRIHTAGFQVTPPIANLPLFPVNLGRPTDWNSPLGTYLRALRAKGLEV